MRFVCLPHFGHIYTCRSGISPVAVTTNREAATEIAKTVGKDAATAALGHLSGKVTEGYIHDAESKRLAQKGVEALGRLID